jgi:hypothetical protein
MGIKTALRERIEGEERTRGKALMEKLMAIAKRIASRLIATAAHRTRP